MHLPEALAKPRHLDPLSRVQASLSLTQWGLECIYTSVLLSGWDSKALKSQLFYPLLFSSRTHVTLWATTDPLSPVQVHHWAL